MIKQRCEVEKAEIKRLGGLSKYIKRLEKKQLDNMSKTTKKGNKK